jgi:hypothetical protein
MKRTLALFVLLLISMVSMSSIQTTRIMAQSSPDVYVGVDMAYCSTVMGSDSAKALIDQVSGYTNLFVAGTTAITNNSTILSDVLQYAYDRNLSFISFLPDTFENTSDHSDPNFVHQATQWLENAQTNWGNHLLGFLHPVKDEPGGHVLDNWPTNEVWLTNTPPIILQNTTASLSDHYVANYTDAASKFETLLNTQLHNSVLDAINSTKQYPLFTSDYALYWFDYKGGYDTVFAEFGWNYSRQLNIALCRGAAQMLNKDWGAVITYTYTDPPYIESSDKLYADMTLAYNSGAKYIIVFDSNEL